jgi:hypothetical protein
MPVELLLEVDRVPVAAFAPHFAGHDREAREKEEQTATETQG